MIDNFPILFILSLTGNTLSMSITRATKIVGFSMPPQMEKELQEMAKEEQRTKSEPFREMFRMYRRHRGKHREPKIDGEWVMQVIREAEEEQKRDPMTPEELVAEFDELAREGGERAKKLGIKLEDVDKIIR